jgi:hypothetical protein
MSAMRRSISLALLLSVAGLAHGRGPRVGIDFEDVKLEGQPHVELESGVEFVDPATQVGVRIVAGAGLRVYDMPRFSGDSKVPGQALIDWHWPAGSNPEGTRIKLGRPITSLTLTAGDWGSDDDGELSLVAFDCEGKTIAKDGVKWGADKFPPFARLEVSVNHDGPGICSVHYRSGGQYAGSTFIDNIVIEPRSATIAK